MIFCLLFIIICQTTFAETMTLEEFLSKATTSNLDLKVSQAKSDAADSRSIGLSIPPPMVGITQFKETSGGTTSGFEVSQMIPFPTKLTSEHSARKYEAQMEKENRLAAQKKTLAQGKLIYFSAWQSQERLEILQEKKGVLKDHIRLSKSAARSDSFAAIHVLKAESELDLLENEIESAKQIFREKQIDAALFINANSANFNLMTTEPKISSIPKIDSNEESHQIKALRFQLENLKEKEFEAKSSWLPDFNLRYKEMAATSTSSKYNELMVGVTLPFVFFWEPYSTSSSAAKARLAGQYEFEKQNRIIESDKVMLLSRAESLKKQIDNLNNQLIPRAEKRMKLVHNLTPRDMETIQDYRETMEAFPDIKLKSLDLRMDYELAISSLEKYSSSKDDK